MESSGMEDTIFTQISRIYLTLKRKQRITDTSVLLLGSLIQLLGSLIQQETPGKGAIAST